jgi:hypothetical protein
MTNLDKIAEAWERNADCERCPLYDDCNTSCSEYFAKKITDEEWLGGECEK